VIVGLFREASRARQAAAVQAELATRADALGKEYSQLLQKYGEVTRGLQATPGQRAELTRLGAQVAEQDVCSRYALCGYDAATWRQQFLHEFKTGTWHVIVRSQPHGAVNAANVEKASLQKRFPNLDFDVIPTESPDGINRQIAIVVASGLNDSRLADKIVSFVKDLGVASDAYKTKQVA
jgi:hypothetical protein